MRTAKEYIEQEMDIVCPEGQHITMEWFKQNDLPPIVKCLCCDSSMLLFSALIDEEGNIYCRSCVEGA